MARIDAFFKVMVDNGSSDLFMCTGSPPMLKISGEIQAIKFGELTHEQNKAFLYEIMTDYHRKIFEEHNDVDFAYENDYARYRANVFMQRKGIAGIFRQIPSKILTAKQLGLPPAVLKFGDFKKGLCLVTGATGSGKSTTLAALIDYINENYKYHILTLEDPIEFVHPNKQSLVNQREIHRHTHSFSTALRAALREAPDVILVGEMRDLETIEKAVEAAETGHLVFGTLHTNSAAKTVDRIINVFPADRQEQIRQMLAEALIGVVAQNLLKKTGGGRCAALEILIRTPALGNLIRENKTFQIPSLMQTNKQMGMQTMDQSLLELVQQNKVTLEEARRYAIDRKSFDAKAQEMAKFK
ncbi:MAG: type IV pilus twitching motility protein PilT [Gemmatimonadetes bacterium]|nr:MAG: type IV pilus twitching motility protein PilT [Gemmatimonadota bacterium]